jgi:RNA-directed DNA polymerase
VSLATPPKLRRFQEALYTKAKQEPAYRFYLLYDKVYRADILAHAYVLSRQHGGAPGVDGVTFDDIEAAGRERWLAAVQEALRTETYRPQPVRRVRIPKPGGTGERPLGIPTVTAYCGPIQRAFRLSPRDAPVPPVGGPALTDPLCAAPRGQSAVCL